MSRAVDRMDEKLDKIKAATHEDADARTKRMCKRVCVHGTVGPLACPYVRRNVAENVNKQKLDVPHQIQNNLIRIMQLVMGLVLQEDA